MLFDDRLNESLSKKLNLRTPINLNEEESEKDQVNVKESLEKIANYAAHTKQYAERVNKEAQVALHNGDIREVRVRLAELFGAVDSLKTESDKLAEYYGLPNLKV